MTTTGTTITVQGDIHAPVEKVWQLWSNPVDITNWNTPSPDWHTPRAENDLREGGRFLSRMEAKDGSFGFDFEGVYDEVKTNQLIIYTLSDNRKVKIVFTSNGTSTTVTTTFEAETENPIDFQRDGWQAILDNFIRYAEKTVVLEYTVQINADKKKVWESMFNPTTYKEWSNAGWKDSYFEGKWEEGEHLKFLSPSGEGTLVTLVSHKQYDHSHAKHIAVILKGGVEDRESEQAKGWVGSHERYTLTEEKGITTLKVDITTTKEWAGMFNDGWPNALKKLKEICER